MIQRKVFLSFDETMISDQSDGNLGFKMGIEYSQDV